MKSKFVIFGSSGHAKVILENINSQEDFEFLGWIDPNEKKGTKIFGHSVLGSENDLTSLYREQKFSGIIGIGNIQLRKKIRESILSKIPRFEFINAIHSSCIISPSANLGKGVAIMPGAILNANAKIGDHCIINTGAQIDHDCHIEAFVNISPKVIMGGNVNIGSESLVGIGSLLTNNLSISEKTIIKAGTIISKSQ